MVTVRRLPMFILLALLIAFAAFHEGGHATAAAATLATTQTPVETALAPLGTNLVRVWGFQAGPNAKFLLYDPGNTQASDLKELRVGSAYWVNVKESQTVRLGGFTYSLNQWWNLIGWLGENPPPGKTTIRAITKNLASLATDPHLRVWGYEGQRFMLYDPCCPSHSDLNTLIQGDGYWIRVSTAQTVMLGGYFYALEAGWNLIAWLGENPLG